jgi:AcrR family transcriptional regulator
VVKQERAQQTRLALLRAAAAEFDRYGYAGTSLSRITRAAGVTMGALTFHFPTKSALADAVRARAAATTRAAVHPAAGRGPADLADVLLGLLENDPEVRAAARLTRERPEAPDNWYAVWAPALCGDPGDPEPATALDPDDADLPIDLALVAYCLVAGAEAVLRGEIPAAGTAARPGEVRRRLHQAWRRVLSG